MKKFLLYLFRSYWWSVIAIAVATLLMSTIIYYFDGSIEKTPFNTPLFVVIICSIMYPLFNLPVLIALYKYRLSKTEVIIESICLVLAITYFYDVVKFFVPHHLLWNHQTVDGREVFERVWWYEHDLNIIYGICITIFLCLVYFKVKKMLGGKRRLREGKERKIKGKGSLQAAHSAPVRRATWPAMAMVAHQPLTEPSVDAGKHLHYIHSMGDHDALKISTPSFLGVWSIFVTGTSLVCQEPPCRSFPIWLC